MSILGKMVVTAVLSILAVSACRGESGADILKAGGVKGGLVVHIGCGNGALTAELGRSERFIVQGLDTDPANVAKARENIRKTGAYGRISAAVFNGRTLHYADNLVNLVLVSSAGCQVPPEEIRRVLAPGGVAIVDGKKTVKPVPEDIDEWTHYLYDSRSNAVSHDKRVGPPTSLQWVSSPRWSRHHDHMSSVNAVVSSGGRIISILDEGPTSAIQLPPDWQVVARDAFNGKLLWKRSISEWHPHLWPAKSGYAQLPRRLVAVGDKVYVTLGIKAPVSELDAATGKTLKTYEGTALAEEIVLAGDLLLVKTNAKPDDLPPWKLKTVRCWTEARRANGTRPWKWVSSDKTKILALQARSGKVLWEKKDVVAPITLSANDRFVLYHNGSKVVCLERRTGRELWKSEYTMGVDSVPTKAAPNLVIYGKVVLFSSGPGEVASMSIEDGKTLWIDTHGGTGHQSTYDLLVANDLVWSTAGGRIRTRLKAKPKARRARKPGWTYFGRDPVTGETKAEFPPGKSDWFHHRCHRGRATDLYMIMSRTGIEYIDLKTGKWTPNPWVRGACLYGIMPANGLTYAPPHPCACYIESKLNGFNAMTSRRSTKVAKPTEADRLEKGPAYGKVAPPDRRAAKADSWPTYRSDAMRSGSTGTRVSADLKEAWTARPGGRLSSPVVAGGKVFVAGVDDHAVYAFKVADGSSVWTFTAGGRVDTPPTVYRGGVLFGSADGWVYCLRESDGLLVWRFRAVAEERHIVSYDQLESAWPVHGAVLVQPSEAPGGRGSVYCVAGRSMFLDGGLHLLKLDAETGEKQFERVMGDTIPGSDRPLHTTARGLDMPVALGDVLSSDGKRLYMRSQSITLDGKRTDLRASGASDQGGEQAHLVCPGGFLDDTWFHRSYWVFGHGYGAGHNGWFRAGRFAPAGRMLVFDEDTVYGYGRQPALFVWSSTLEYQLFAAERQVKPKSIKRTLAANRRQEGRAPGGHGHGITFDRNLMRKYPLAEISAVDFKWRQKEPPLLARAMVLAGPSTKLGTGKTLFVAGPRDVVNEEDIFARPFDPQVAAKAARQVAALKGTTGSLLLAVSAKDGGKLSELKLDSNPVFDGMAAAEGKLFLTMMDGSLRCFGAK